MLTIKVSVSIKTCLSATVNIFSSDRKYTNIINIFFSQGQVWSLSQQNLLRLVGVTAIALNVCVFVCGGSKALLSFIKEDVLYLRRSLLSLAIVLQSTRLLRMDGLYMKTNNTISAQRLLRWKRAVSSAKRTLETFLSLRVKVKESSSGDT